LPTSGEISHSAYPPRLPAGEPAFCGRATLARGLFGLSTPGVFPGRHHCATAWALTSRFHPYPRTGGIFSVALSVTRGLRLQVPLLSQGGMLCVVRTFLPASQQSDRPGCLAAKVGRKSR